MAAAAAGAAFGGAAAASAIGGAEWARSSLARSASAALDRWAGRRYSAAQRQRLEAYRRFCLQHCRSTASLDFFAFDDAEECPAKGKDDLVEQHAPLDNADSPFNLCRERRALVRCIRRSCDAHWRSQEAAPVCAPEVYVLSELQRWSRSLSSEPSQELIGILEGRKRYADEVERLSQKHGQIPGMAKLLAALAEMLASCRVKLQHHQCRQLLPRIHGEANAACEGMDVILGSILSCAKPEAASPEADSEEVEACTLQIFRQASSARPGQESPFALREDLRRLAREAREVNEQVVATYLLWSDGLPLTSVSHVDEDVVRTLRQGLCSLREKLETLRGKLQMLCGQCRVWYGSGRTAARFRNWQANYDDIRVDIEEAHAAIDRCLRNIGDADSLLCQRAGGHATSGSIRSRSASPLSLRKRLKLD